MTRFRTAALVALALSVAACDGADPEATPEGLLTVTARTAAGAPAAGLDLFATYGSLIPDADARSAAGSGALFVSAPFPTPTTTLSLVRFEASEAGPVRVRVLDVAGAEQAVVFDGSLAAGLHQVAVDVSEWPGGVYRVVVEAGGESATSYLLKTDAVGDGVQTGLAVFLGRTDDDGRVVVTDSTRFPALFDVPRSYVAVDEQGNEVGRFEVGRTLGLVLQDAGERTDGRTVTLRDGGTAVDLTFAP
ncbi:hypothetical protein [Rubrivirga sp.]|uniref:hypothetical protein n=1 Tax=Rubrivirga sp. TaxID=1885344 RepID=UPI003B519C05